MSDASRNAPDIPRDAPPLKREIGELIEDFIGVGAADLRMIRDLYWRPRRVVHAMAAGRRDEYGSAFRLWVGVVGLLLLSTLLGGGMGQTIIAADARGDGSLEAMITETGMDYDAVIRDFESWVSLLAAPVSALAMIPVIFLLRSFARRIRLSRQLQVLAAITVSMTLLNVFLMPFILRNAGEPGVAFIGMGTYLVFLITFARGGRGLYHHSVGGMVGKTALIGGMTMILNVLAGFITMMAALVLAILQNASA